MSALSPAAATPPRSQGWTKTPHEYLLRLHRYVSPAGHALLGVVLDHTVGRQRPRVRLSVPELAHTLARSHRSVQYAVREVISLGLLGASGDAKSPSWYWCRTDNWNEVLPVRRRPGRPRHDQGRLDRKLPVSASVPSVPAEYCCTPPVQTIAPPGANNCTPLLLPEEVVLRAESKSL